MKRIKKIILPSLGIGLINGLLGSGGGMIAVPFLKSKGYSQKEAQANAIAIIFPVSVISIIAYLFSGPLPVAETLPYAVAGVAGSLLGTFILTKLKNKVLSVIFSIFMIYAGVRLLLK